MISINPTCTSGSTSAYGWKYPFHNDRKFWIKNQSFPLEHNLTNIAEAIEYHAWSPFNYTGSYRNEGEFLESQYLGLDFDSGFSLQWALGHFKDYACVIGTTRNHQLPKDGKPACDRFRVLLRLSENCSDKANLRHTIALLTKKYGTDKSCVDVARFYFPCRDIEFIGHEHGKTIDIVTAPPQPVYVAKTPSQMPEPKGWGRAVAKLFSGFGFIVGERHETILAASKSLVSFHKKSPSEAFEIIRPYTDKTDSEIQKCIEYASTKGGQV